MKYTLSVLAENQPGVLSKVVSLFSRRGYNIDSLAVGATEDPTVSRMTIVGEGDDRILEQVEKQLNKVIQVIKVRSLGPDATQAELMLVKLGCDPQSFGEINQIAALMKAEVVSSRSRRQLLEGFSAAAPVGAGRVPPARSASLFLRKSTGFLPAG